MVDAYKKAFEEFEAAAFDPAVGDKVARGKDRESGAVMAELKDKRSKADAMTSAAASKDADSAPLLGMVVMVAGAVLGMASGIGLSRQMVLPLARAEELADKVRSIS